MALPDIAETRKLSDTEINEQISGTRRELFDLRFQPNGMRAHGPGPHPRG